MTSSQPDDDHAARDPRPPLLRLLVVDADRRVRSSLAGLLGLADQVEVVGSAGHARAALDVCEADRPDAVVVDPRLPELPDGIAFIRALRLDQPAVRVIVIAWSPVLAAEFGDDPEVTVVAADGGDLAERIVDVLRAPAGEDHGSGPGADARLGPTA